MHVYETGNVRLLLLDTSENDGQGSGAVTSVAKVFDPGTGLLAKHAQHVVLVHFPIALFLAGVAFDWAGRWTRRKALAEAAYYNLLIAAASTLPGVATGLVGWPCPLVGEG